ncbi:hypothetical protein QF035_000112 [Streptomyces umbrinus]|uniref:Uncharacterized protein n=1 Tax=Streptomyces umbrinus TaxID=67370 RepID=A0ABU0SG49_9ACTN|nr:hypothetical protein [Streptomyces umbrinus]MDQ1022530.1 hypothetical protein [Streptomyces umbrinus]
METRIVALQAAAADLALTDFRQDVPILAASLVDLLHNGPAAPVWRPVQDPDRRVVWHRP